MERPGSLPSAPSAGGAPRALAPGPAQDAASTTGKWILQPFCTLGTQPMLMHCVVLKGSWCLQSPICYLLYIVGWLLTTDFMPSSSILTLKHLKVLFLFLLSLKKKKKPNSFFIPLPSLATALYISPHYGQIS